MILDLPSSFYNGSDPRTFVSVKDNYLIIGNSVNYNRLIYDLAYKINGKKECYYCKGKIPKGKATQDHLYPQGMGGVTITNNLVTACSHCNQSKSDLNEEQFREWQMLDSKKQKRKYEADVRKINEEIKYKKGFYLPDEWISYISIDEIHNLFIDRNTSYDSKKLCKIRSFIQKYGQMPRPLIVSNENILLDGGKLFMAASNMGYKEIPTIVLDNVEKRTRV